MNEQFRAAFVEWIRANPQDAAKLFADFAADEMRETTLLVMAMHGNNMGLACPDIAYKEAA